MFVLWHEKILIWGRERNESVVSRARESHVFFFVISLSLFFFVCGQLNFSLASLKIALLLCRRSEKKLYSCVFLGDFITCGVHVREGVFFNEHNTTRCFTKKKSREKKLFLVSSFFVVT